MPDNATPTAKAGAPRTPWLAVRQPLGPKQRLVLVVLALLLPLGAWCAVSYLPFLWHPLIEITESGDTYLQKTKLYEPSMVERTNAEATAQGRSPATGVPANPVFLPAPHEVATALVTGFTTEPARKGAPWMHESIWHSIQIIFWGFLYSCLLGVPLGILAGTFDFFARLIEPPVDFVRYMPAPAFGGLMVAILGTADAPKIAIIFIGTFFQMVLVVAGTTRLVDRSLLEAAQTLGASRGKLLTRVIVPGILPQLYDDMRILLGWAWTYLIIAELIGAKSGISAYISDMGRYFHYDRVYAALIILGLIGLFTDQSLRFLSRFIFPWQATPTGRFSRGLWATLTFLPRNTVGLAWRTARERNQPTLAYAGPEGVKSAASATEAKDAH